MPEYFFITSYGRTATVWLAHALNLHPDIICSHGPSFDPIMPCNGVPYTYSKESVTHAQSSAPQFYAQNLNQILTRLRGTGKARWVGNVHGFTASALWLRRWTETGAPPFRSVNLLRHPVTRADSFWRRWQYERGLDTPVTRWIAAKALQKPQYKRIARELQRYHDVALESFEERAFFYAIMQMTMDDRDIRMGTKQIISEELVSNMDYFAYTLKKLMGDAIDITNEYLDNVQHLGKQNEAKGGGRSATQIFNEWKPWQRTLFMMFMRDYPKLKARYQSYGYLLPESDSSTTEIEEKSRLAQALESVIYADVAGALRSVGRSIRRNLELS